MPPMMKRMMLRTPSVAIATMRFVWSTGFFVGGVTLCALGVGEGCTVGVACGASTWMLAVAESDGG
jgi:hypothetical protein